MAETTKKAKAPAKARTASSAETPNDAPKATKAAAKKAAPKAHPVPPRPSHEDIARLAQQYWAERGHADGQAEQDWLRAEQELMKIAS